MEKEHALSKLIDRVIDPGLCAACGACVAGCPYLVKFKGKTVKLHDCSLEHGRCFAYCPMTFFDHQAISRMVFHKDHDPNGVGIYKRVLAAKAAENKIAEAGQGGGVVSALISYSLEHGLIDAVVTTKGELRSFFGQGTVATTKEEVLSCAGSRYVGAHSLTALRDALDSGYQRIGIVGLPCQVKSARKMAHLDIKKEGLSKRIALIIGLFCNWAFSAREFDQYLSMKFNVGDVLGYHIPPPPADVMTIQTQTGKLEIPLDELRPMIQAACSVCDDMTSQFADISVGMREGGEGWNTVISRTDPGDELLSNTMAAENILTDTYDRAELDHLAKAADNKRKRAQDD